ncbi:MAG: ACP S-malonyltransferase [Clostridia bacterium]|nr:ACP S-malonyltransferase [Clostridia bacterium]
MKVSAFFPGQGAQYPGMGQSIYESSAAAKQIFDCASDIAGQSLPELCFSSSKEELSRTVNSQIAIFTCSMAALAALQERGMVFDSCAGFSLGEYTALTAAGVLTLEGGLRLVRRRGELMQEAADRTDGCMAAVLGLKDAIVEEICSQADGLVLPVNYNCDGQLVIAGERAAVDIAAAKCKEAGARRVMPLAVSGGFHTPLMAPAAAQLRTFAQSLSFSAPTMPLYTNVTGEILSVTDYPAHLEQHMVSPVRWKQLVQNMIADGHTAALEIGAGKTLTGFSRRISKEFTCKNVETMENVIFAAE